MTPPITPERCKHHRFPAEIISHGVWLYYRFCLSYRDVEELLFVRGVLVSYEALRKWCRKFGQAYAGLDHSVGHLRICAVDFEARAANRRSPKLPQT